MLIIEHYRQQVNSSRSRIDQFQPVDESVNRPGFLPQFVAGALYNYELFGFAGPFVQLMSVADRHRFILIAVNEQQRPGSDTGDVIKGSNEFQVIEPASYRRRKTVIADGTDATVAVDD